MRQITLSLIISMAALATIILQQTININFINGLEDINFIIAYFISMIIIATPLIISQTSSATLQPKNSIFKLFKHYSKSNKFRWLAFLVIIVSIIFSFMFLFISSQSIIHILGNISSKSLPTPKTSQYNYSVIFGIAILFALTYLILILKNNKVMFLMMLALAGYLLFIVFIALNINIYDIKSFFIFKPEKLLSFSIWYHAIYMAILTTLVGTGGILAFTQISKKINFRCFAYSFIVANTIIAALYLIISNQNYINHIQHTDIFYGILFFSSITLSILLLNFLISNISQTFNIAHKKIVTLIILILVTAFLVTISYYYKPNYLLDIGYFFVKISLLVVCYSQFILFGWMYDAQKLSYEINKNCKIKLSFMFNILMRIISPSIVLTIIFYTVTNIQEFYIGLVFILAAIFTIVFGSILHKRYS